MLPFGLPLRRRFLLERGTAFLNHGSFGATPRSVLAAAGRWRARMEASPDRFLRYVMPDALRAAAGKLATFLKAQVYNVPTDYDRLLEHFERLRPGRRRK